MRSSALFSDHATDTLWPGASNGATYGYIRTNHPALPSPLYPDGWWPPGTYSPGYHFYSVRSQAEIAGLNTCFNDGSVRFVPGDELFWHLDYFPPIVGEKGRPVPY